MKFETERKTDRTLFSNLSAKLKIFFYDQIKLFLKKCFKSESFGIQYNRGVGGLTRNLRTKASRSRTRDLKTLGLKSFLSLTPLKAKYDKLKLKLRSGKHYGLKTSCNICIS
jgi:hypothetical protein